MSVGLGQDWARELGERGWSDSGGGALLGSLGIANNLLFPSRGGTPLPGAQRQPRRSSAS